MAGCPPPPPGRLRGARPVGHVSPGISRTSPRLAEAFRIGLFRTEYRFEHDERFQTRALFCFRLARLRKHAIQFFFFRTREIGVQFSCVRCAHSCLKRAHGSVRRATSRVRLENELKCSRRRRRVPKRELTA